MTVHTFHLADVPRSVGARALMRPPSSATAPGLDHAECLALMRLGAPTVSPDRLQLRRMAVFAQWRDEDAARALPGRGRRSAGTSPAAGTCAWSSCVAGRPWPPCPACPSAPGSGTQDEPVVAVTVARMRLREVPRFLHWGKPVERLVRDHPGVTLALAGFRPPRTISTFSVWRTVREMEEMVHGRSAVPDPERHAAAMAERDAATSTTSSRRTASGRSRSTAPGRGGPASCRRAAV